MLIETVFLSMGKKKNTHIKFPYLDLCVFNTLTCFINGRLANSKAPDGGHKTSQLTSFCATVNSEIFVRILFSRYFADVEFREYKPSRNGESALCPSLMYVNHAKVANFNMENMYFSAIRENKIIAKISELTV